MSGASQGRSGMNTIIQMGDGLSPEEFSVIPEPKDIDGPELTPEFADATHMQSPSGHRERKPTVKSNSQVTFRCNKLAGNTVQDALIAAAMTQPPTLKNFTMTYPDGDVIPFAAYPSVRFTSPMLGMMEIHVTLSLTGPFMHSEPVNPVDPEPASLGLGAVVGAFCHDGGVIQPIEIGYGGTFRVPLGATSLQVGINDDHFDDNEGNGFPISVSCNGYVWNGTITPKIMPWDISMNPGIEYGIDDGDAPIVVPIALSFGDMVTIACEDGFINMNGLNLPVYTPLGDQSFDPRSPGSTGEWYPSKYMPFNL